MMLRSERARRPRVLMLIENVPLARDHRLRKQAAALLASRFEVTVICQRDPRNKACVPGVRVLEYPAPPEGSGLLAFAGGEGGFGGGGGGPRSPPSPLSRAGATALAT